MNLDPESTALVAIHCQGDIIGAEGAFADFFHAEVVNRGIVGKLSGLLEGAREAGATVIYTQIAYNPDYSDLNANSPLLRIAQQRESLKHGSAHTNFIEQHAPQDTDLVLTNQRVGGFTPEMASILEDRGIQTLVFAGVATNISVESSARAASDHGFHVAIVEDACSAATPGAHAASIESLGLLASITTSSELGWAR
ncbi:cysteine hydrolase [Paeniglutamicibacter psychrophenolicus]|uniref:Nicotinamidase-related amidase n=1 Tax=Paeniglutamicibacter psychrophenolicus TaxID=257454 RepID=A0ABS4W9Z5_9MICC|nr:cysteine hydrolase [Paeniglutamicibacter psychrophenolicus]MBP2373019.1 nicotinamidase-related amidase [Paeniglutamicibacter psychrophenolicus]